MASRFYFPSDGTPPLTSLGFQSGWNKMVGVLRIPLVTVRSGTAYLTRSMTSTATAPEFICTAQFQIGGLAAQTFGGTLKGQMLAVENNTAFNGTLAIAARVVSSDGSTLRGTLFGPTAADATTTPPEFVAGTLTQLKNRKFMDDVENANISVAAVTSISGDVLVVEIGCRDNDTGTSRQGTIEIGDSTTDSELAEDETSSQPGVSWIEFSQTILFQASIPSLSWMNDSFNEIIKFLRRPKRMIPSGPKLG